MENLSIEELLKSASKYPLAIRNNGGGYYNHNLYWKFMKPKGGGQPTGPLLDAIKKSFGSFDDFRNNFHQQLQHVLVPAGPGLSRHHQDL